MSEKKKKAPKSRLKKEKTVLSKIETTISTYQMISPGDSILVGLSGGPDSIALLLLLSRLQKKLQINKISAVYINHHIRPKAAKQEAELCRALCKSKRISFFYEEVDIPALTAGLKSSVEETARIHRYEIFDRLCKSEKIDKIALGHHRDDRVETILFNLCRGAGRHGLAGIPPIRGKIIRPLYDLTKEEILSYLAKEKIGFSLDRSNKSMKHTRNRIRHRIIPALKKHISASAPDNIARLSNILTAEEHFLNGLATKAFQRIKSVTPGGKIRLDLSKKFGYDEWLMRRLMMLLLADAGLYEISHDDVLALVDLAKIKGNKRLQIRGHLTAEKFGDFLYLFGSAEKIGRVDLTETLPRQAGWGEKIRLKHPRIWIRYEYSQADGVIDFAGQPPTCARLDGDRIVGSLYVGGIKPGQRFHPFNRPGSKKVGDFLTDRKYPRPLRDELPIIYDDKGIVWVIGVEIDDRVRLTRRSEKMVKFEYGRY